MSRARTASLTGAPVLVAVVGLVALAAGLIVAEARADPECRISGGHASILVRHVPSGPPIYEGSMYLVTRDCGAGAKALRGTFTPVGGTPATCSPEPSTRAHEAVCTFAGSAGLGPAGTPVVVHATAEVVGLTRRSQYIDEPIDDEIDEARDTEAEPSAGQATSICVVEMPEIGGRFACTLF